jgi:hypothetical protein
MSNELPNSDPKTKGVNRGWGKNFDYSLNNTINWDYVFAGKHHVMVTLAQEAEERRYRSDNIEARNILPSDALGSHNTQNASKEDSKFSTEDTHETALPTSVASSTVTMTGICSRVLFVETAIRPSERLILGLSSLHSLLHGLSATRSLLISLG